MNGCWVQTRDRDIEGGVDTSMDACIKRLLDIFFYQCNYTFLHYQNTIDYSHTEIAYYLVKYYNIYIADDLIWYALFSTPYSLYNYSQNLTNLKYRKQYDYGYLTEDECSKYRKDGS